MSFEFLLRFCCPAAFVVCVGLLGCSQNESATPMAGDTSITVVEEERVAVPSVAILDASWSGDLDAIRQHIAAGTDLNTRGEDGGTCLNAAAAMGNTDAAILLIEAGADVNAKKADGATPLHTAAFFCHEKIVRSLLANGADKTLRNNVGATAYDSVAGPFEDVKPIYDLVLGIMGPLGLQLDYERIKAERPNIAEMLSAQ